MKQELQEQQFKKNAGDIKSHAEKELDKVKKEHAKIKGVWVRIPEFHPPTEIFIRQGQKIEKKITEFKEKRKYQELNKYR